MSVLNAATAHGWKDVSDITLAEQMIDRGIVLPWNEARRIQKAFNRNELVQLMGHAAIRFCERIDQRLAQEILVETVIVLLASGSNQEVLLQGFIETLVVQPEFPDASIKLVEISLTTEPSESEHDDIIFSMSVSMVCELGLAVREFGKMEESDSAIAQSILSHISTYLMSVSNTNNAAIRLSLLNYFGSIEAESLNREGFNKMMGRFGHTVLEQLFYLLFKKKSEGVALQYLLQNTPFILMGDRHAQRIIHETWKFYMLKNPERFGLFVQTLAQHMNTLVVQRPEMTEAVRVFCQHLGILLNVVSDVNHRELAREIVCAFVLFRDKVACHEVLKDLLAQDHLRSNIKDIVLKILDTHVDTEKVVELASRFVATKRGRRPSFQKIDVLFTVNQVHILGQQQAQLAAARAV